MARRSCGIDFGTSNSTVAVDAGNGARLIPLEAGEPTLPSAVFWEAESGRPLFGRAAIAAYVGGEDGRLMRGLKSTLGTTLIREKTRVGRRSLAFTEILGRFLGHLRARLDAEAGPGIEAAVLGRPVHFVDDDPEGDAAAQGVLERLARDCGFREVGFQFEPIAAALDYESGIAGEELVLIVDIGGGTSDFSVVRVSPERARAADRAADILANDGIRVGGTDFDRALSLAEVMPHLGFGSTTRGGAGFVPRHAYVDLATWHRINHAYTARNEADFRAILREADRPELVGRMLAVLEGRHGHGLAIATEAAKIALSEAETAPIRIAAILGGTDPQVRRAGFEAAAEGLTGRIRARIAEVLAQAGIGPEAVGTVFMTGGSARLPVLRQVVAEALPGRPVATGDMLGSVGTGLALDARRRFG